MLQYSIIPKIFIWFPNLCIFVSILSVMSTSHDFRGNQIISRNDIFFYQSFFFLEKSEINAIWTQLSLSDVFISWSSVLASYSFPSVFIFLPWKLFGCFWHLFLHFHPLAQRQAKLSGSGNASICYKSITHAIFCNYGPVMHWLGLSVQKVRWIFSHQTLEQVFAWGEQVHYLTSGACFDKLLPPKVSLRIGNFADDIHTPV